MPPYFMAEVKRSSELIAAPPDWAQVPPTDPERLWYVISGTLIFEQFEDPHASSFNPDFSTLSYNLPLAVGKQWCPIQLDVKNATNPRDVHCAANGLRTVVARTAYETPAGKFETCYEITEAFVSGGVTHWFCEGIGLVAASYDHHGSRFGFRQTLISYSSSNSQSSTIH